MFDWMETAPMSAAVARADGHRRSSPRPVFVLVTSRQATTRALQKAAQLVGESGRSIVLLVPHVTTFTAPVDPPANAAVELADEYRDLAVRAGVDAFVRVCVCKRIQDIFKQLMHHPSTIVIGGRSRGWLRPTAELQLARTLVAHDVVFEELRADAGMRPAPLLETT